MTSFFKKIFSNNWVIGIGTGTVSGFIILALSDWFNKTPILTSFNILSTLFLALMNSSLKLWWVLLAMLLLSSIYIIVKMIKTSPIDEMLAYKADKFGHHIWQWDWRYNDILKRYEVKNASPLCNQEECNHLTGQHPDKQTPL